MLHSFIKDKKLYCDVKGFKMSDFDDSKKHQQKISAKLLILKYDTIKVLLNRV